MVMGVFGRMEWMVNYGLLGLECNLELDRLYVQVLRFRNSYGIFVVSS